MKRIITLALIMLILSPLGLALDRQIPLEEAKKSDEGVYRFLEILLNYAISSTNAIVDERNTSIDYSNLLGARLNQTVEEISFYKSKGVTSAVEEYIPPFLGLHDGIRDIIKGQMLFLGNIDRVKEKDRRAYALALNGVEMGKEGILKVNESIRAIAEFTFVSEEQNELKLNTDRLEENLKKIQKMFQSYERILREYDVLGGEDRLTLYASDLNPPVFENVTFYGHAKGLEKINLHVKDSNGLETILLVSVSKDRFRFVYSFSEIGTYKVFVTGKKNGKILRSNTLILNVSRIPTEIIAYGGSAYIGTSFELTGVLQDYRGNPLKGQTVFITFKNTSMSTATDDTGAFSANLTSKQAGRYEVKVSYNGDELYAPTSSTVKVAFLRRPLMIKLNSQEKIKVGKPLKVEAVVASKYEVPITIYVDGKQYKEIKAKGNFEFTVVFNETGRHDIQAVFQGDSFYAPSKSNILSVEVIEGVPILKAILFLILSVGGFLAYKALSAKTTIDGMSEEEFLALLKAQEKEEKKQKKRSKKLNDYYKVLYSRLIKTYRLKRSTTPRELLARVKDEPFVGDLAIATILHEKYTYSKKRLSSNEIIEFIRSVGRTLLGFLVRDEL
ncbi:hypothetical protein PAP_09795 [Palaeococcus pacificus DY20341]|uniref:Big-1 domain-containing protein n=1 Tax=Palaeococcus pacificus DY20341 TaxID=1343739 RepID=A0A075LVG6_9EURY|nr:Ig-like domain-containing protein [Palaeococcus pacificus]AIF70334.1 hypothetical protein PAP_09795 [Palaeococcus pacificus DY20341]